MLTNPLTGRADAGGHGRRVEDDVRLVGDGRRLEVQRGRGVGVLTNWMVLKPMTVGPSCAGTTGRDSRSR